VTNEAIQMLQGAAEEVDKHASALLKLGLPVELVRAIRGYAEKLTADIPPDDLAEAG